MNVILLISTFFVAGAQEGTAAWYLKNADDAIAKAKRSNRAEAMRIVDEMRKTAEAKKQQVFQDFARLTAGQCEYYLGNMSQCIAILEKLEGNTKFARYHEVVRDLGEAHLESGNPGKAQKYLRLAIDTKNLGEDAPRVRLRLIQCRVALSKMEEARQDLATERKALDGIKATTPAERWICLDAQWNLLHANLDIEERDPLHALARLDATQKNLKKVTLDPDLASEALDLRFRAHILMARDYWLVARFADSEAQLDQAEVISTRVATERNLASLKNARAALTIERSALALEAQFQGAEILADLAAAKKYLEAALGHHRKTGSGADLLTSIFQYQLSQVHELRGRVLEGQGKQPEARGEFQTARDHCELTLNWRAKTFQASHDLVLEARTMRAWLNFRLGDLKSAEREGAEALKLFDSTHKKNDLDRGRFLHVMMEIENKLGNLPAAIQYAQEHRRLVDDGLPKLVAGLSPAEQIQFFRRWDTPGFNASMRMGIERPQDANLAAACAEWLINGKSKLAEVLAAQVKAARQADQEHFARFQTAVQHQAYLMYGEPILDAESLQAARKLFLLEESRKRDVAKSAASKVVAQTRWYTLEDIQARLHADELYVGIYCLHTEASKPREYHAWLFGQKGAVQTVPLGSAAVIEDLVRAFVREQERVPLLTPGEEKRAELFLRKNCLNPLSELVLKPILERAGGAKRWIVSPDGALWNVPWAALLMPDKQYAIEHLTFRYAVSGQDLVPDAAPLAKGEPLVLGDPWFNYPATDVQRLRKPGIDPLRLPWDRLEYSRRECETVLAIMEESKLKPERRFGAVQKSELLSLKRAPRMLYFSTHAYAALPSKVEVDDPLLSCALAFAGWNYVPPQNEAALPGLMTGSEVLGMDLRGTELVVLASCTATKEEPTFGRSPANLRHAFHLAGARAVVSALWGINDKATLELMEPFMDLVCHHSADKVSALRDAQQQSIRYLRMYRDHTHPFYWAGFTISGS